MDARRARFASVAAVCLAFAMVLSGLMIRDAAASGCPPGWKVEKDVDNSFEWKNSNLLPTKIVTWTGKVQLLVNYGSDCTIYDVEVAYTGSPGGGILAITGDPLVSFTVQYPSAFTSYSNKGLNAYGDLVSWNPPEGDYVTHIVKTNFNINGRGADEYTIEGGGITALVTSVGATFALPLELLGQTVKAQMHVGPNACLCRVTSLDIPAGPPPPPPPPPEFDFQLSADPTSGNVLPGGSVSSDITATLTSGTPNAVTFDASGLPADTTVSFAPSLCAPTCTSTMTVDTTASTPAGTFTITVSASDGTVSRYATFTLVVDSPGPPPATWSAYIHAHNDDWQLFMAPNTVSDYQAGNRLLFIIVTAGDAGNSMSYWSAREEAHEASVRYFVGDATETAATVSICYYDPATVCHPIREWSYGTTITLFMRLPDGNNDGSGFAQYGFQSLSKLRDGLILSISAVDGSTTYNSWEDLYLTIAAAVSHYAPFDSTTWINAPDFDRNRQSFEGLNCNGCADHADHLAVADAVYAITIAAGAPWSRAWYIDYAIGFADSRYPANLDSSGYDMKKGLFMAYSARMKELTGEDTYGSNPSFWENCFHRTYFRTA